MSVLYYQHKHRLYMLTDSLLPLFNLAQIFSGLLPHIIETYFTDICLVK